MFTPWRHKKKYSFRYHRIMFFLVLTCLLAYCSKKNTSSANNNTNNQASFDAEVTVLAASTNQVIEGFGCATAFSPPNTTPITSDEFDRLFGSGNGQVGLNILRIRLASDSSWRAVELGNAKAAIQRGAKVIASPWSPPANMKNNNNIIAGSLIPDSSAAYAKYLNDFANYMSASGAPVYGISVQNEPDVNVGYESCSWNANDIRDFVKNYGQLVTSTKLFAPESYNNNPVFVNTLLADDAAASHTSIIAGHIYGGGIAENQAARSRGKEVWMTEHLDTSTTYSANLNTAVEIHDCLTKANFSAYLWWYGKRFYGPIGQDGLVTKRGFMMSQFARFIKPGATRLSTTNNTRSDLLVSAFKNSNNKLVIVAINTNAVTLKQKISVQDVAVSQVMPYTTSNSSNTEAGTLLSVSANSFIYPLLPYSVTTFVEP